MTYIHNKMLLSHKNKQNLSFLTQIELDEVMLSEIR